MAGNTEVSQAVCNALFGALGALACSQATMNNVLFGDATRQYYETICGGMGAGPDGRRRLGDPDPHDQHAHDRPGDAGAALSGGAGGSSGSGAAPAAPGGQRGGDGSVRRIRFNEPMTVVVVASRREVAPFGLEGGADGLPGRQWVERAGGEVETMSGTSRAELQPGDVFVIETPGGGGFGAQ